MLSPCLTALEIAPFMPSLPSPPRSSLPPSGIYNNPLYIKTHDSNLANAYLYSRIFSVTLISTLPAPVDFNPPKTLIASNLSFTNSLIIFSYVQLEFFNHLSPKVGSLNDLGSPNSKSLIPSFKSICITPLNFAPSGITE